MLVFLDSAPTRRAVLGLAVAVCLLPTMALAQSRDFHSQDLTRRDFSGQRLEGADFSEAILVGVNFDRAVLNGGNFRATDMSGVRLIEASAANADFREAVVFTFTTQNSDFTGANFEGANFTHVLFLGRVKLLNANLRGTKGWAGIAGLDLHGADIRGADFRYSRTRAGTEILAFRGAIYDDTTLWPSWFDLERSGAVRAKP